MVCLWIRRVYHCVFFRPYGACSRVYEATHSLRCGLHSVAASRLGSRPCLGQARGWDSVSVLLSTTEFGEHAWFDVTAGDDRHIQLCLGQLIGAEEESGGRDRTAGFGYCFWIR